MSSLSATLAEEITSNKWSMEHSGAIGYRDLIGVKGQGVPT
jgi:hypothetical protein